MHFDEGLLIDGRGFFPHALNICRRSRPLPVTGIYWFALRRGVGLGVRECLVAHWDSVAT